MDKKIAIFYHMCDLPRWEEVFEEQMNLLLDVGLMDAADIIHIGINGDARPQLKRDNIVYHINPEPWKEETDTLKMVRDFSRENENYNILYFHMKGITRFGVQSVTDWRKMMEHYCIKQWKECVELLYFYDSVGCNYVEATWLGHKPHFSGGLWWTTPEYINKLDHSYLDTELRYDREFWIGTGGGTMHSVHNSNIDHYIENYPEIFWTKIKR